MTNEYGLASRVAALPHRSGRPSAPLAFSILISLARLVCHVQPLAQRFGQVDVLRLHLGHAAGDHVTFDQVEGQGDGAGDPQSYQQHDPGVPDASDDPVDGVAEGEPQADQNQRPGGATEQGQRPEPAEKPHVGESEKDRARRPQPVNVLDQEDGINAEASAQALQLRLSAPIEITVLDPLFAGVTDQVADRVADEAAEDAYDQRLAETEEAVMREDSGEQ